MTPPQLAYFKGKLTTRHELAVECIAATRAALAEATRDSGDEADRADAVISRGLALRTIAHAQAEVNRITDALRRMQDGEYGYCEETGEPIGIARLEAEPTARVSIESQERAEAVARRYASNAR